MKLPLAMVLGALSLSAHANLVVTIDFDDLADAQLVGASYAAMGVSSTNASVMAAAGLAPSAPNVIQHATSGIRPMPGDPIRFLFSADVSSLSIDAVDAGENGARIEAFDVGGVMLDFDQYVGVDNGDGTAQLLQVVAAGIRRIDLFRVNDIDNSQDPLGSGVYDGLVWDNLSYSINLPGTVPEPSSLALGGLALCAALGLRRRRAAG